MFLDYVNAKRVSIIKVLAEIAPCAQRSDNQVNAITTTTTTTTTLSSIIASPTPSRKRCVQSEHVA